jgi:hypothetical protein
MESITMQDRIHAFVKLGNYIRSMGINERKALAEKTRNENPWFVEESVNLALRGVEVLLNSQALPDWVNSYSPDPPLPRSVGVAMAGNIPLVGFHDFMCVLISGHRLKAKISSQDSVLIKHLAKTLLEIEPRLVARYSQEVNLKGVDAIIATGSDNTSRYFEYYFRNIPHIIRKNRASCAVLIGEESSDELQKLGQDVFNYFGLGCRNISKLFVPEEFEFSKLFESWEVFSKAMDHRKYFNNYDYQKSLLLLNQESFLDNGFVLVKESDSLVSPVAVLYFEKYANQDDLRERLATHKDKLQIVVSAGGWYEGSVAFGMAQLPGVSDYADKVDTMRFLKGLK